MSEMKRIPSNEEVVKSAEDLLKNSERLDELVEKISLDAENLFRDVFVTDVSQEDFKKVIRTQTRKSVVMLAEMLRKNPSIIREEAGRKQQSNK